MSAKRESYEIRPLDEAVGLYLSNLHVFVRRVRECLVSLERIAAEIKQKWPAPPDQALKDAKQNYPQLEALCFERDLLCDSVLIFAAMAVEAFLNYYGVVRMGEREFARHFERLGIDAKLRALLLFCDSIRLADDDALIVSAKELARKRNALVHPKTRELTNDLPAEARLGPLVPEHAQKIVAAMNLFFEEFEAVVPNAKHLIP